MKAKPMREVLLQSVRGPGYPNGWWWCARICNRHGRIKKQLNASMISKWFAEGFSAENLATLFRTDREHIEEILRLMQKRRSRK